MLGRIASTSFHPQAQVQLCILYLVRHSLNYVGRKQREEVASDLQTAYRAATREEAGLRLWGFAEKWGSQFPTISRSWRSNREALDFGYADSRPSGAGRVRGEKRASLLSGWP